MAFNESFYRSEITLLNATIKNQSGSIDLAARLLANVEKDGCYYCPLNSSCDSLVNNLKNCFIENNKKLAENVTNVDDINIDKIQPCSAENWKEFLIKNGKF